jgi:hypothetical protein
MKLIHQTFAIFSALLIFGWANTSTVQAQDETLEEILEAHFEAVGQEKLNEVKSMTMTGLMSANGMELKMEIKQMRPLYYHTKMLIQGMEIISAFDGENGWMKSPMQAAGKPVKMPEDQTKRTMEQADMDGFLYNYKEKGHKLVLIGEEEVEGTNTYKLKLTKSQGDEVLMFLDKDSYILIKTIAKMDMMGQEMEAETFYSNYKMIDGVAIATSIEVKAGSQGGMTMQFDDIEFNVELDEEMFKIPGGLENATEPYKEESARDKKIKEVKEKAEKAEKAKEEEKKEKKEGDGNK